MIRGIGIDLVEIQRIAQSIERSGDSFLTFVFTTDELANAPSADEPSNPRRLEYFAGRWAAKEAVSKALGTGIGSKCALRDINVKHNENGRPEVYLSGSAAATAASMNIVCWNISISHDKTHATAVAICEG